MRKYIIGRTSLPSPQAQTLVAPSGPDHPVSTHPPTEARWQAAFELAKEGDKLLGKNNFNDAQDRFQKAIPILLEIKSELRPYVFAMEANKEILIPKTDKNEALIHRYIEVIDFLIQLQISKNLYLYEEAVPSLQDLLVLAEYTGESTSCELFNLGAVYRELYKDQRTLAHLYRSSDFFLQALAEYRKHSPDDVESCFPEIIENLQLRAAHGNTLSTFVFETLPEPERNLLWAIISDILTPEQLISLVQSGDKKFGFFAEGKWEHSFDTHPLLTSSQCRKIRVLQKKLIPNLDGKKSVEETQSKKRSPPREDISSSESVPLRKSMGARLNGRESPSIAALAKTLLQNGVAPYEDDFCEIPPLHSNFTENNRYLFFATDPEVRTLMERKAQAERQAEVARMAAQRLRQELSGTIEGALKALDKEASELQEEAREKNLAILRSQTQAAKRDLESAEQARDEMKIAVNAKREKLAEKQSELDGLTEMLRGNFPMAFK